MRRRTLGVISRLASPVLPRDAANFLKGGELASLIRAFDWSQTPLGPIERWPQSLKTATGLLLLSAVPMVMLWGPDGTMIYNDAYSVFAARRHPGLLGSKVREGWPEVASFNDNVMRVGLSGGTLAYTDQELILFRHGAPEQVWMNLDYSPVLGEDGEPAGVIAIVIETTERVLANQRLAAEHERLGHLFEQAPSFMTLLQGPEHRIEMANAAYMRLIGNRSIVGKTVAEALPEAAEQGFVTLLDWVYDNGKPFTAHDIPFLVQPVVDGPMDERFVDLLYQPMRDAAGQVTGIFVEGVDVTGRKRAEAARRRSEAYRSALLDLSDRIRDLTDPAEIAFAASEVLATALGVSRAGYGLIDKQNETITIERDWNASGIKSLAGVLHFRNYGSYIDDLKRGETVAVDDAETDPRTAGTASALKAISAQAFINMPLIEQGEFVALLYANHEAARVWSADDFALMKEVAERVRTATERARTETALRESEEQFRAFAQAVPNQIWAARADGFMYWFNDQVYNYTGTAAGSLDGLENWTGVVLPDDLPDAGVAWMRALRDGGVYEAEFRIKRFDGAVRWFLVRAEPIRAHDGTIVRWVGTNTDIDDRKRQASELAQLNATLEQQVSARTRDLMVTEEALRQSQKMEAVGQLTGGIAHDFNNLLTGITGSMEMLQARVSQGRIGELDRYITAAQGAARRAASLTHRLLAFSRRQPLDPKPINVNRLVADMEDLIRRTIGPSVTLETVALGGLWNTRVDPGQLENSLLNLCINARDAMPGGGRLTVETANSWLDERGARERNLDPGQYVSLCVSDTGTGMPPDVIARVFEPFYTTKPIGQGTGLGLSMVYGFARQSLGQVRVYSEVGRGTTVCIYLPRYMGDLPPESEVDTDSERLAGRSETVLVIDDEPTVRMLITEVLDELGYVALEAADGPSGLRILDSDAQIDLLVTDVGLPGGMDGRQVADAARLRRPDLKVLFITGFAENAAITHGHLDPGMHVLTKPFAMDALAARMRTIIES